MVKVGDVRGWWLLGLAGLFLLTLFWRARRRAAPLTTFFILRRLAGRLAPASPRLRWLRHVLRALFAAAGLAAAAAALQPYYTSQAPPFRELAILDLSPSLAVEERGKPRRELLRARVGELLDRLQQPDSVQFLTAGEHAAVTPPLRVPEARKWLAGLDHYDGRADVAGAVRLAAFLAARTPFDHILIFTDRTARWSELLAADGVDGVRPRPGAVSSGAAAGAAADNSGIVAFEVRPDLLRAAAYDVYLRIFCPRPVGDGSVTLTVLNNGRPTEKLSRRCGPGQMQEVLLGGRELAPGTLEVRLEPGGVYAGDDVVQAGLGDPARLRVHLVTTGSRYLEAALAGQAGVELAVWSPTAAVPWDAGAIYVFDGKVPFETLPDRAVFIQPDRPLEELRAEGLLSYPERVESEPLDPLLRGTDLAGLVVRGYLSYPSPGAFQVAASADGRPLILHTERGARRWVVLAFDPAETALVYSPDFPVFMANSVRWLSALLAGGSFSRLGEQVVLPAAAAGGRLRTPTGKFLPVPAGVEGQLPLTAAGHPGTYEVFAADQQPLGRFHLNLLDPAVTQEVTAAGYGAGGSALPPELDRGALRVEFAPWLAVAALAFLALEALLVSNPGSRRVGG